MQVNDLNLKSWNRIKSDSCGNIIFKSWEDVPYKMQDTYRKVTENAIFQNREFIQVDFSQPQHTTQGKLVNWVMYSQVKLLEARGGYESNGGMNTLYAFDTKENILLFLELTEMEALERFKNEDTKDEISAFVSEWKTIIVDSDERVIRIEREMFKKQKIVA